MPQTFLPPTRTSFGYFKSSGDDKRKPKSSTAACTASPAANVITRTSEGGIAGRKITEQ
jgi:hypothetical protein